MRLARDRHARLWAWVQSLFFASFLVWFLAFAWGLFGRVSPHF